MAWIEIHNESQKELDQFEKWKIRHKELIGYVHQKQGELFPDEASIEDADEDVIPAEFLDKAEEKELKRDEFDIPGLLNDAYNDLDQLVVFLTELKSFKPKQDKKLTALIQLLSKNSILKEHKVLIFTEYMTTARYLAKQLQDNGIEGVEELDSTRNIKNRGLVIKRFSPYYNGSSSGELAEAGQEEIRVLISTDVLSEGLNLQDCTRLINYDIHWNPVRLMQRIGRVDRRLNLDTEARIIADHPDQEKLRGTTAYWNFLPPDDLETLLGLYRRVSHKTLRISKTLGIEGGKLLKEDDDYEDLRNFTELCEGVISPLEALDLELQKLLRDHPDLEARLDDFPHRVFSGREHPSKDAKAVFFCYARPVHTESGSDTPLTMGEGQGEGSGGLVTRGMGGGNIATGGMGSGGASSGGGWSCEPGDIHWNPVRLMQRIGRVDRRLNLDTEARIIADHPDQEKLRGTTAYWNFLPPDDLETLLGLYRRVSHKTLRISKTLGIEGGKLLKEDDDYEDLRNFTELCEGVISPLEALDLELQKLLRDHPDLEARLDDFPHRVFSGREHPSKDAKAVFFCYARPVHTESGSDTPLTMGEGQGEGSGGLVTRGMGGGNIATGGMGSGGASSGGGWSCEPGDIQWYLYSMSEGEIIEDPAAIAEFIRSAQDTTRTCIMEHADLITMRKKMDTHIKNTYLKKVQAPAGIKPVLKCWMELN